jgi:hypothetical protein
MPSMSVSGHVAMLQTSPERGMYYHSSRHWGGRTHRRGLGLFLDRAGRLRAGELDGASPRAAAAPQENANAVAAEQIAALVPQLPAERSLPWFLFDSGYDPVQLTQALEETPAAILVRLRSGRCFYAEPTTQAHTGRPRRHGHKFVCDAPQTWPAPADDLTVEDERYGTVRMRAWTGLHPGDARPECSAGCARSPTHCPRNAPARRGDSLAVSTSTSPKRSGSDWHTPQDLRAILNLDRAWRAYVRR